MRSTIHFFAIFALLFIPGLGSAQRGSSIPKTKPTIPFTFSARDFGELKIEDIAAEKAPESDEPQMPFDAPAHRCYNLVRKAPLPAFDKGARYFFPAYNFICLVPTSDPSVENFAKAYPNFNKAVKQIQNLTKTKTADFKQFDDLFDFPYNNAGWSITAKREYLDFPTLTGVFFLVQYSQDITPNPLNNEELTANFQGITKDHLYYVAARFSITHPRLPKGIDFVDDSIQEKCLGIRYPGINDCVGSYLRIEADKLGKFSDREFQPSIGKIKSLLSSINPQ
jgi:hypothetical protein